MYLEQYVGRYVVFDLVESAKNDRTMKVFYENTEKDGFIRNKLIAVDQLGIWVEGFKETTTYYDNEMIKLDEPITEWITFQVMVRWEYLQGIFVVDDPELNEKRIGFK